MPVLRKEVQTFILTEGPRPPTITFPLVPLYHCFASSAVYTIAFQHKHSSRDENWTKITHNLNTQTWLQEGLLSTRFISVFPTLLFSAFVERRHRNMLAVSHFLVSVGASGCLEGPSWEAGRATQLCLHVHMTLL